MDGENKSKRMTTIATPSGKSCVFHAIRVFYFRKKILFSGGACLVVNEGGRVTMSQQIQDYIPPQKENLTTWAKWCYVRQHVYTIL